MSQEARLPLIHARQLASILRKLAQSSQRMRDLLYVMTGMWHETGAQRKGTIHRETCFISDASEWILSGPHIFVGNPFFQTPNAGCRSKGDYSSLDLTVLPESYLPRTNYVRACSESEYTNRTRQTPWGTLVTDEFRVVMRARLNIGQERTVIPALLPPSTGHIDTLITVGSRDCLYLLQMFVTLLSIVTDYDGKDQRERKVKRRFIRCISNSICTVCSHSTCTRALMLNAGLSTTMERTYFQARILGLSRKSCLAGLVQARPPSGSRLVR